MSKKRKSVGDEMQVNLLGVRLRIGGPAREIAHLRNSLFSRCNEPPGPKPNASIQFEIDCGTYRAWFVDKSSEPIYESDDRSDFFWWLDNELFRKSLKKSPHLIQVHGGAVEKGGKAILFLGDSYAGKSTMTLHLLRQGYRFLTDEVILIDPRTLRVAPFHRNLLVRQGAIDGNPILKKYCRGNWHYEDYHGEMKWLIDPAKLGPAAKPRKSVIKRIYLLRRHRGWRPKLESATEREVVEQMIKMAFNKHRFGEEVVDALVQIAKASENFKIRSPHGGEAWKLLKEHMDISKD
ncbi:MAG: hypothetical protein HOC91_13390 [Nitrospinaceae bacterium]|jgi:hypothetical protein|nr:hypothetical protein [Nitrospinaceae bacterium]MBT3433678.1 hypothetical protein [Nitrospinaceae bacterium]MBT3820787.1 hypothetical protein [Nitrospinaceae bacterium]MBT4095533.1 hypothetical protein [Nitrospinaceae bacterium]MBT4431501.1 hypothetical protein [Nitrospinaceae bacterium]